MHNITKWMQAVVFTSTLFVGAQACATNTAPETEPTVKLSSMLKTLADKGYKNIHPRL